MENVNNLLLELEEELLKGRKGLMGTSITVNRETVMDLIYRLKESLPKSIDVANNIVAEIDSIQKMAVEQAQIIAREARINADNMVKNSSVLLEAQNEANIIISKAYSKTDVYKYKIESELDKMLEGVESQLKRALTLIDNQRNSLKDEDA